MLVECANCEATVDAQSVGDFSRFDPELDDVPNRYSLLKCPRCTGPLLAREEASGSEWVDAVRIFPPNQDSVSYTLPPAIRKAYMEAAVCFKAKAYTATAVMCRKTLEGMYKENKIEAKTLDAALKKMRDEGIIENRLFEWSDTLRIAGNEAAHDVHVTVSKEDARDLLDFTKALLEYVFTFKDKYDEFMERRSKAKSKSGT